MTTTAQAPAAPTPGEPNTADGHAGAPVRGRHPVVVVWALVLGVLMAISAVWALATPISGSPDEPAHIVRAVSLVRGTMIGGPVPGKGTAWTQVRVPETYAQLADQEPCYQFRDDIPAGCSPKLVSSSRMATATTWVGRYPPLYYFVVGLPSLADTSLTSIYWMRMLSALVADALLAGAFALAWRWSRSGLLVAGVALAATPTELFLAGSVNPSSWEVAAAIALWVSLAVIVIDHPLHPPRPAVAMAAVSACLLCLMRAISPLWVVVIAVCLLPFAWGRLPLRRWWARDDILVGMGVTALVGIGAVVLVLRWNSTAVNPVNPPPKGTSTASIVETSVGKIGTLLDQAIGVFGWNDVFAPLLALLIWIVGVGIVVGLGLLVSNRRLLVSTVLVLLASTVTPVLVAAISARHDGFLGQGRYYLPAAVGLPLLATAVLVPPAALRRRLHRFAVGLVIAVCVGQWLSLMWALRRYTVGMAVPFTLNGHGKGVWVPPAPAWVLVLCFLVPCAAYGALVVRLLRRPALEPGGARPASGR